MNNFNSVFEELSKLYEEDAQEAELLKKKTTEACAKDLTEAAEDEIAEDDFADEEGIAEVPVDEEEPAIEEEPVEDEPRQVIIECDKCGALVIKDEADLVIDEESDLVNVDEECQFCEETKGYKIIGVVAPFEAVVEEEPVEEEMPVEEEPVVEESVELDEGIEHWYHKKFDKPYTITAQQQLEDELNGECGEISDERRKEIEEIFAWQRDWEARHADELEEFLDVKPNISLSLDGGEGNDVDVL